MPELPEMENYKTLLSNQILGKKITEVEVNRDKSINVDQDLFIEKVSQQTIKEIKRRAKQLIFLLDNGESLLLHLMLGGWMYYGAAEDKPNRTIQIRLEFGDLSLYFIGLRLGYLHLYDDGQLESELSELGPEPLDINFSLDEFLEKLNKKNSTLKSTLVDQQFVAGIGNRYSDEICWDAKVLPSRNASELKEEEKVQLYHSMRNVLHQAAQKGGYMDQALYKGDVQTGGFSAHFNVYKLEGTSCKRCGTTITKDKIASKNPTIVLVVRAKRI